MYTHGSHTYMYTHGTARPPPILPPLTAWPAWSPNKRSVARRGGSCGLLALALALALRLLGPDAAEMAGLDWTVFSPKSGLGLRQGCSCRARACRGGSSSQVNMSGRHALAGVLGSNSCQIYSEDSAVLGG